MARELSKAALVVLLSEYETHPIAVLEALSLGRPVLVADTSGLSELAQNGLAQAIPLKSTTAQITDAIVEQLLHPQKPPAVNLPTWDDCAAGLLSLYGSVISGRMTCTS
jgi:glycosyltransferase involved in cell wall biosynthesis